MPDEWLWNEAAYLNALVRWYEVNMPDIPSCRRIADTPLLDSGDDSRNAERGI